MKLLFASIAGLAAIAASTQAAHARMAEAGPHAPQLNRSLVVSYADLDLATPEGSQAMVRRISGAAARACRGSSGLRLDREAAQCREKAVAEAVGQLRSPQVSLAYRARQERLAANRVLVPAG